jgi:hypothetical protein
LPLWSSPPTMTLLGAMSMTPLSAILSSCVKTVGLMLPSKMRHS